MRKIQRTELHPLIQLMVLPPEEIARRSRKTIIDIGKGIQLTLAIFTALAERMPIKEMPAIPEGEKTPTLFSRMAKLEERHGDWNRKDWYP